MVLGEVSRGERRARATSLLESVGLGQRLSHRPNELSGGEKQRVAIARALANRPTLLLADEPTGNLDTRTGATILDLLCGFVRQNSLTLVMVTHDLEVASRADRIVHLRDGAIQQIETKSLAGAPV
jgi:putative ABC transport system ATP-binding protein